MKGKILSFIAFSTFYSALSAEAFFLPPFKIDASTIGKEVMSSANTVSQTAGKGVQQASIIQTTITYGQGAKEAYEFSTKILNEYGALDLNSLGNVIGDIEKKEAEQTKLKADAATEIASLTQETNAKIVELDNNTRELLKKIVEDPENTEKYQKQIQKNEKKKKELSADLIKKTRKINKDTDKKTSSISDQISELQGKASDMISSITTIPASYDSSEDLKTTTETLIPGKDTVVDTHVSATYVTIYKVAYFNTMSKSIGRVMLLKSRIPDDNKKATENKISSANLESLGGAVGTAVKMKTDNIQALLNFTEILLQKMQLDVARDLAMENFSTADPEQAAGDFNLDNYKFTPPDAAELEAAEAEEQKELEKLEEKITPSSGSILTDAKGNMVSANEENKEKSEATEGDE